MKAVLSFPLILLNTTCLVALAAPPARSADRTWSGPAGGDWTNAGNWGGTVPGSTDNAVIQSGTANGPDVNTATSTVGNIFVGRTGTGTLAVSDGGTLTFLGGAWIGDSAGSSGTVRVTGAGSQWSGGATSGLYIGNNGGGTLAISDGGGVVSDQWITVGRNMGSTGVMVIESAGTAHSTRGTLGYAGGTGSVTVTGAGSSWVIGGTGFFAGGNGASVGGSGTLNVEDGGSVSSAFGYLGYGVAGSASASISGAGSTWTIGSDLSVGYAGSGTLEIEAGGAVSSANSYIGQNAGSEGTLLVSSGGTFHSMVWGAIGAAADSNGTVTVTGTQSNWTSDGDIAVGNNGSGSLTISDEGSVSNGNSYIGHYAGSEGTLLVSSGGTLHSTVWGGIGDAAGSIGAATVTGTGSNWTSDGNIAVGNNGSGTLLMLDGGTVASANGYVGNFAGSSGAVTVSGSGSAWSVGTFSVGQGGDGTLTVSDAGVVSASEGYIGILAGSTGSAVVTGSGSAWISSADFTVGNSGDGTLTVSNGGAVENSAGHIGRNAGSAGRATVTGAGSVWASSAELVVGEGGSGALSVLAGGAVSNADGIIGHGAGSTGAVAVMGSGSTWTSADTLVVGESGAGTLNVFAEGHVSSADGVIGGNAGSTGVARVNRTGSSWTNSGELVVGENGAGELYVQEGATVAAGQVLSIGRNSGAIGSMAIESTGEVHSVRGEVGYAGGTGSAVVTGDGSVWAIDTNLYLASSENPGDPAGSATVTLTDRGEIRLPGTVYLAGAELSQAILNIGAAAGDAAAAAGTLVADRVAFGDGDGEIVFNHTSSAYAFAPDITGSGTITILAGNTMLAGDLSGFSGNASIAEGANLTTASAQDASLANLSENAASAMIESRAVGQQLLGANRPIAAQNYGFAEAMYGSAQGMIGGQYAIGGLSLFGGAAYGTQDYDGVEQDGATTLALGGRYMLGEGSIRPFAELGGWITPNGNLSLQRIYVINALPGSPDGETATGTGVARAQSWAGYGRVGVVLTAAGRHQLVGYGEIGRQSLAYDDYVESSGPFRATVDDGNLSFNVARLGGSYTHDLGKLLPIRSAITLSGAAARSFGTEGGIEAEVAGERMTADAADDASWGEFGARLHLRASDDVALSLGLTGTTQWDGMDTAVHGFVGVSYRF